MESSHEMMEGGLLETNRKMTQHGGGNFTETKVRKARDRFSHETDIVTEEKRSATNEAGESELGTVKVGEGKLTIEAYSSVKFKARMLDKGITKSSLETMQLPRKENLVIIGTEDGQETSHQSTNTFGNPDGGGQDRKKREHGDKTEMIKDAGADNNNDNYAKIGHAKERGMERNIYECKLKDIDFITEYKLENRDVTRNFIGHP